MLLAQQHQHLNTTRLSDAESKVKFEHKYRLDQVKLRSSTLTLSV
uniref:Uncharacterized protein n=1 Tax=Moniliophthora roreri TaxID=221103 RepID=A0A0W0FLY1_MONRR